MENLEIYYREVNSRWASGDGLLAINFHDRIFGK